MWPVNEPSTLCQYPALAQVIRRGDVREGPLVFARNLSEEKTFSAQAMKDVAIKVDISGPYEMSSEQGINARSLASYYAAAVGKTGVQFGKTDERRFLHRPGPLPRHAEEGDPLGHGRALLELRPGLPHREHAADAGGRGLPGRDARQAGRLPDQHFQPLASILVASWDGKPLKESKHILITAVGRSRNTDMAYSRGGQRLIAIGKPPVLLEGVRGTVRLARSGPCTVTALSPYGYKTADVRAPPRAAATVVPLDGRNKAAYYDVRFE